MLNPVQQKHSSAQVTHSPKQTIYYLAVLVLTIATLFAFDYLTKQALLRSISSEKLLFGGLSAFMNVFVLQYHFSNQPHPKFTLKPLDRLLLHVHIVAGCLELAACLIAYFTGNVAWALGAAIIALTGQIPTAYYHTSTVFGVKAVMIGSYLFVITLHLFCAVHLLINPDSTYWLLNTFLTLNTYVWVRVFYFLFNRIGLFQKNVYTASVLMACMLVLPFVLNIAGNLIFWCYVAATAWLYYLIKKPDARSHTHYVTEYAREDVTPTEHVWGSSKGKKQNLLPQRPKPSLRARSRTR